MKTTLASLIRRVEFCTKMLHIHPEHKEMLERKISETKSLIIERICNNGGNEHV